MVFAVVASGREFRERVLVQGEVVEEGIGFCEEGCDCRGGEGVGDDEVAVFVEEGDLGRGEALGFFGVGGHFGSFDIGCGGGGVRWREGSSDVFFKIAIWGIGFYEEEIQSE